jgi:hypothetical protein
VSEPFKDIEDARALAQAIVDTVREPLLVLDGDLRVLAVSRSYYSLMLHERMNSTLSNTKHPSGAASSRACLARSSFRRELNRNVIDHDRAVCSHQKIGLEHDPRKWGPVSRDHEKSYFRENRQNNQNLLRPGGTMPFPGH